MKKKIIKMYNEYYQDRKYLGNYELVNILAQGKYGKLWVAKNKLNK